MIIKSNWVTKHYEPDIHYAMDISPQDLIEQLTLAQAGELYRLTLEKIINSVSTPQEQKPPAIEIAIRELLEKKGAIAAIIEYRRLVECDLATAKKYVDGLRQEQKPPAIEKSCFNCGSSCPAAGETKEGRVCRMWKEQAKTELPDEIKPLGVGLTNSAGRWVNEANKLIDIINQLIRWAKEQK